MEKFSYETNGYNRSEVNQFISDVIKETEVILSRVKTQNIQIQELKKELNHYKNMKSTIDDAIIKSTSTGEEIRRIAREESDIIIDNARHNASRIVNEALLKAEKINQQRDLLEKNMKIFKRKLKLIMEQQMAVVEEIEILELEE